ncbi:ubiquitin-conjugating enzyme E2 W [Cryptococcus neoformans C23]|uniref:Ubiquitin-conjugating enzyme E2 W n=1 Tax=Cryptococcus neoformans Tu259-1 TaxID=1230072 RepID=A0A854QCY7_CRYNE|nr:ubiquitin-conjugating enzyme E2 W [Cryptococcus neoformans var. grubii AD2-60a]OWZ40735.1 ubiquitin-conjugating enzyme E2 W [Cryptococcus neoformans var. grubii AD1-83a]OWZ43216.1 ubiquitin-conjugating enzyme E2 W [Cryptococcus neoformans var. grubii C23]OWZ54059.1 ubiquitin-conjugating enzyme E2 W [Cryptococcus neoformans var. grubii 125.91]OXC84094.1 ubiquitin-conjugating enzyme E2 W [Cryptococcus neoformans var. grubii AD1-7a]OXG19961.1 ubiquitin-conjugating enzyme E2 W [Cryptococcus neo
MPGVRLATKRLMKELGDIENKGTPPGIALLSADSMEEWIFTIAVLGDETIYKGEQFALRIKFEDRYPIEVPQVTFVVDDTWKAPIHPHIYSNGHICASILGNDWSPVLNAVSICITMQSMLASNKSKVRPEGDQRYVRNAPANPKLTSWRYDDDVCTK